MSLHYRFIRQASLRLLALFIIASVSIPVPVAQAEALGDHGRRAFSSAVSYLTGRFPTPVKVAKNSASHLNGSEEDSWRASGVAHLKLCPRRLVMYVGESYVLVPLALNHEKEPVHGLSAEWNSDRPEVAEVSQTGDVLAAAPGKALATVAVGNKRANVSIEVREGVRPRLSDDEYDLQQANDCFEPETSEQSESSDANGMVAGQGGGGRPEPAVLSGAKAAGLGLAYSARPASLYLPATGRKGVGTGRKLVPASGGSMLRAAMPQISPQIDGDGPDTLSAAVASPVNAVGSPRLAAAEESSGATKTRRILGSNNYQFTAPVLSLGGRGIGVNLSLVYNSRLWSKDTNGMTFNYNKGWPAAGWTLGYGRLVRNYDNTGTGDLSGSSSANAPGNALLIQPDGTRVHLAQSYDMASASWVNTSTDGNFIKMQPQNSLVIYPDGTQINYNSINNRHLPAKIRTRNGDMITIAYKTYSKTGFKVRWAIDYIYDSLGRYIYFNYDSTAALTSITAPDRNGGARTLVEFDYQAITLQYNFNVPVDQITNPASGSPLKVLRRIYYPATGQGYLFPDYSSYGMIRHISVRKDMKGTAGAVTDGTEIAYTKYNYVDVSTQVGSLNDSPQYTRRSEWWQGKTDNSGNADNTPSEYEYRRAAGVDANGFAVKINTAIDPNNILLSDADANKFKIISTVGDDQTNAPSSYGRVTSVEYKKGSTVLRKVAYTYTNDPSGGVQLASTELTEGGRTIKTTYDYGNYGRLANIYEYGDKPAIQRRTRYRYSDAASHLGANLVRLVNQVAVFNASAQMVARTDYSYDDYGVKGGMESYGLTSTTYPPNHNGTFSQSYTARGNVTGVTTYSNVTSNISTTRYTKYDLFGNVVEEDISCCTVKARGYGGGVSGHHYSQPLWARDGNAGGPNLTTSFQYDFNTGLVTGATDPNNLTTNFTYDGAWRPYTVTVPTGAVTKTSFDKDGNGNDQLVHSEQLSYVDNGAGKTITSKRWFNGAGQVLGSGAGAGVSPGSFDLTANVYDKLGRLLKQSNPYQGDYAGNGTPQHWTTTTYDELSREIIVTLPDGQTVLTGYAGAKTTTTDQVGRKREAEFDGLGRLIKVVEQNPATGALDATNHLTSYGYDTFDNLTQVNQGGQIRTYVYDALSRLTSETTPEAGSVSYTYTDFNAVATRTDARGVVTTYGYDALTRLQNISYNTTGAAGVAATDNVTYTYDNSVTSTTKGKLLRIDRGTTYREDYSYDSYTRVSSVLKTIDARAYTTQYSYNTAGQLVQLTYPSGKQVKTGYDQRGRVNSLTKVGGGSYLSQVSYNTAGQAAGLSLGNGAVESYGYSAERLQMTTQSVTRAGATLMSLSYGYQAGAGASGTGTQSGNSGQLVSISGTVNGQQRNQAFTYDNVARLLTATGNNWQRRYGYDRFGNRTAMYNAVSGGVPIQSVSLTQSNAVATNRIASVDGAAYGYDASGNVTTDGLYTYKYDGEGRQVSVNNAATSASSYDVSNRRVKKVAGGVTTHYVWEGGQVIAEYNGGTGAVVSEYLYAGGRMVAREQGTQIRYFHMDRLSTRMLTDGAGAVAGTQDHLPFGEDAATGVGEQAKHKFTSYERDPESLGDYAINRQMSFNAGRFLQADPIAGDINNPQTLNRYAYSHNDPVNKIDPLGLKPYDWTTDASIHGPGVYLDGFLMSNGMEDFVFRILGTEGAAIGPGSTTRWNPQLLQFEFFNAFADGSAGWQPKSLIGWSALDIFTAMKSSGVLAMRVTNSDNQTWEETLKAYESVAALLGGKVVIKDNTTFIIGVTMSYKQVIETLKQNGWSAFTNLNPAHSGGTDLKNSGPPWFHITVGYAVSPSFSEASGYSRINPNEPPIWITIHGEPNDPSSFRHFFYDYALPKIIEGLKYLP